MFNKPGIVSIPDTTKLYRLEENIEATNIEPTPNDLLEIEDTATKIQVQGAGLLEALLKLNGH